MENSQQVAPPARHPWRWFKRIVRFALVAMLLAAIYVWWTMIRMPGASYQGELPAADAGLQTLTDELRRDVQQLSVEIGERNLRHRPWQLAGAAKYIEHQFSVAGLESLRQTYEVDGQECSNLIAELPGQSRSAEIVVIGAHYDTFAGTPGANDNTTGVAGMLAVARFMARHHPERTLRFVAFVNEEPPYFQTDDMGSRVYARECRQKNEQIVAMLSLEMLGYYSDEPGSQTYPPPLGLIYSSRANFIGLIGNTASRDLAWQIVGSFRRHESFPSEGAAVPAAIPGVGFSDQWSFWQERYPAIMVTDTAFFRYAHYHRPDDTIDKLNFDRMARVVRGLQQVVLDLANGGA